jgi:hypothetical protein
MGSRDGNQLDRSPDLARTIFQLWHRRVDRQQLLDRPPVSRGVDLGATIAVATWPLLLRAQAWLGDGVSSPSPR